MPKSTQPIATVTLTFKKSTKGTHVYGNDDAGLSGLYFPKLMFGTSGAQPPAEITLTLEDVK